MAPTEHNPLSTGAWSHDDLRKTSSSEVGTGADTDLPNSVRFVAGVAKLIRTRRAISPSNQDVQRPALFLLAPTFAPNDLAMQPKRVPRLQAGLNAVTGRIWFTPATAVTGRYIEHQFEDDDELFQYVTDVLALSDVPAVFYNPLQVPATLAFYERGLGNEEDVQDLQIEQADITLDNIFNVIDHIHLKRLVTPETHAKAGQLWENRDKYWPVQQAEDVVQMYLEVGLTTAFPTCTIRVEQTQATGRLDLEIEQSDFMNPSSVIRHAVLELKVLRSFGSTGISESQQKTANWVHSGMEQAAAYRDERGTRYAALCCFDMRSTDTGDHCFTHVASHAATLEVGLRRWYLYSTSAAYRTALANRRLEA